MKKYSIFFLIIICLAGCKKTSNKVSITGEIKGLGTDTIYLYGMDDTYDRIDTIFVENDKFSFSPKVDTISSALLLFKKQTEYPIFLDKGNKITIQGNANDLTSLTIDGNTYNDEFTAYQASLKGLGTPSESALQQKAEEFIKQHPSSHVSLYLLDKYFVKKDTPDFQRIKKLTGTMTGVLLDKPYVIQLNEIIDQAEKTEVGKYASYFTLPNAKGERINRMSDAFRQKCLLINFWASWNDSTVNKRTNKELRDIYQTYKKNKYLGMIGISFDINKEEWKTAIKKDSLNWEQLCDFDGMNSEVVKQYAIQKLPTNYLLSPEGKILAKDLTGEELKKKIKEAVTEAEIKEKESKKKK